MIKKLLKKMVFWAIVLHLFPVLGASDAGVKGYLIGWFCNGALLMLMLLVNLFMWSIDQPPVYTFKNFI